MPRRSFVLLVLVTLAGLWTAPQGTKAQTGCPEGGCKVFLPLVSTYTYATVVVESLDRSRYCGTEITVSLTNTTTEPITNIVIAGTVTWERPFPFTDTLDIVLFPGETNRYVLSFRNIEINSCGDADEGTADVRVSGATVASQYRSVDFASRTLTLKSFCYGYADYEFSGSIQNTSEETLSNAKVFFLFERDTTIQQYAKLERSILAPDETAAFTLTFGFQENPNICIREPSTVSEEQYTVRAWGEVTP